MVCQQTKKANIREPMLMKAIPEYPWQLVSSDIFTFHGDDYLLVADHYSGFFDFRKLKATTTSEITYHFRDWFSFLGTPEILETDGGSQYTSYDFRTFATDWSLTHKISSPYHPQGNGFAERMVQSAKNLLKRCYLDKTDVRQALLMLRNTDRNETLKSPARRLFSRATRTPITIDQQILKPDIVHGVTEELRRLRTEQNSYADRVTLPRPPIKSGEDVMIQTGHRDWQPATVVQETQNPRSVIVQTPNGKRYRRNSIHLTFVRKTKVKMNNDAKPSKHIENNITSDIVRPSTSNIDSKITSELERHKNSSQTEIIRTRYGRIVRKPDRYSN